MGALKVHIAVFSGLNCVKMQRGSLEYPSASQMVMRLALKLTGKPSMGALKIRVTSFSGLNFVFRQCKASKYPLTSRMVTRLTLELADKPYDMPANSNANRITMQLTDGDSSSDLVSNCNWTEKLVRDNSSGSISGLWFWTVTEKLVRDNSSGSVLGLWFWTVTGLSLVSCSRFETVQISGTTVLVLSQDLKLFKFLVSFYRDSSSDLDLKLFKFLVSFCRDSSSDLVSNCNWIEKLVRDNSSGFVSGLCLWFPVQDLNLFRFLVSGWFGNQFRTGSITDLKLFKFLVSFCRDSSSDLDRFYNCNWLVLDYWLVVQVSDCDCSSDLVSNCNWTEKLVRDNSSRSVSGLCLWFPVQDLKLFRFLVSFCRDSSSDLDLKLFRFLVSFCRDSSLDLDSNFQDWFYNCNWLVLDYCFCRDSSSDLVNWTKKLVRDNSSGSVSGLCLWFPVQDLKLFRFLDWFYNCNWLVLDYWLVVQDLKMFKFLVSFYRDSKFRSVQEWFNNCNWLVLDYWLVVQVLDCDCNSNLVSNCNWTEKLVRDNSSGSVSGLCLWFPVQDLKLFIFLDWFYNSNWLVLDYWLVVQVLDCGFLDCETG
ncbi:hypothetical protein L7F22_031730 [Adiantum nelumboides]|nr:hypothetical protein [Adiantum nelumboides]